MNKYQIHLKDIARILFGQAPLLFLVEVFFQGAYNLYVAIADSKVVRQAHDWRAYYYGDGGYGYARGYCSNPYASAGGVYS